MSLKITTTTHYSMANRITQLVVITSHAMKVFIAYK